MEIKHQGKVLVNTIVDEPALAALVVRIDLESKYAKVVASGGNDKGVPSVYLGISEYTLHIKSSGVGDTKISFPEYTGYTVMCAEISRYTLTVCLCKLENHG